MTHFLWVCLPFSFLSGSRWEGRQWCTRLCKSTLKHYKTPHKVQTQDKRLSLHLFVCFRMPMSYSRPELCGCWDLCCSGLFGCSCTSSRCQSGWSKACCGPSPFLCPCCVTVCRSFCPVFCCCCITCVMLCFLRPPVLCLLMACFSVLAFYCLLSLGKKVNINYII